jgi:hypothetical protein
MSKGSSLPHLPVAVSPMMMMSRLLIIIMGPEQSDERCRAPPPPAGACGAARFAGCARA